MRKITDQYQILYRKYNTWVIIYSFSLFLENENTKKCKFTYYVLGRNIKHKIRPRIIQRRKFFKSIFIFSAITWWNKRIDKGFFGLLPQVLSRGYIKLLWHSRSENSVRKLVTRPCPSTFFEYHLGNWMLLWKESFCFYYRGTKVQGLTTNHEMP